MIHQPSNSVGNYNYNATIYQKILWQMHFHHNYELIYVIKGVNSVKTSALETVMTPGDFLLIPPDEPHSFETSDNSEVWVSVFSKDYISVFTNEYEGTSFSTFRCDADVQKFLNKSLIFNSHDNLYCRMACLYAICDQCVKNAQPVEKYTDIDSMHTILMYIYKNYTENLTLKNTADALGYEYHYFSQIFHKYFSVGFREFLNICRFNKACELMAECNLTLTQIALASGFGCVRSFNRVFKSLSGETPRQYRNHNVV